ncbi:MAG: hypothetical protein AAGA87_16210 [Pseudomonadota bacterium]
MAGSSKILTVSYGTFSCTLEGFDDPFGTMRDIAEYFRDLAADDRYFGAEPPTPDAEMLHRMAETETQRRIESRISDDGIVLRQVNDDDEDLAEAAPQPVQSDAPIADQDDPSENMFADIADADDEAARTDDPAQSPSDTDPEVDPGDTVAAKLSRIRAVVTRGVVPQPAAQFGGPIQSAFADPDPEPKPVDEPIAVAEPIDIEQATEAEAVEDLMALDGVEDTPTAEDTPVSDAEAEADMWSAPSDALEAPLETEAATNEQAFHVEAEAFEAMVGETDTSVEDALASAPEPGAITSKFGDVDAPEDPGSALADDDDEFHVDEPVDVQDDVETAIEEPTVEDAPASSDTTAADAQADADAEKSGLAARIIRLKRAAMGEAEAAAPVIDRGPATEVPAEADSTPEEDTPAPEAPIAEASEPEVADVEVPAPEAKTLVEENEPEEVRSIFDEADDDDDDFDIDDPFGDTAQTDEVKDESDVELDDAPQADPTPEADTKDDSLAALIGQAVQAANGHDDEDAAPQVAEREESEPEADEPEEEDAAAKRRSTLVEPEESGEAFDRILEQTNNRMDDSEGNRRRSAIAHLKAAVAATKADRLLKRRMHPDDEIEEEQSRYRDDLAKVVRPRPTDEAGEATDAEVSDVEDVTDPTPENQPEVAAAEEALPAEPDPLDLAELDDDLPQRKRRARVETRPLILVSEQQIIENARLAEAEDADEDEGGEEDETDFVEFAKQMGATELPDLLEAAAAYNAFVVGQAEFSRPQIMRRVANFDDSKEITREAGLRSFGQLLRQGKIQKLKRGQFTISEDSRFNPRSRIAGE